MNTPTTWIELSLSALNHNIALFKKLLGSTALMAVVKSNAYGHDMLTIAAMCQQNPSIKGFVTVSLSEAIQLRHHGITKPIVVMGYLDTDLASIVTNDIQISVIDHGMLAHLEQLARKHQRILPIHLKIDTGLTRFGFMPDHVLDIAKAINTTKTLTLQGICTHFGESSARDWLYTAEQRLRFFKVVDDLNHDGLMPPLYHADKSSSALRPSERYGNAVRLGAGLYGLLPNYDLRQILTWKTRIAYIRTLEQAAPVGYGRTYYASPHQRIAFIPVGYYDGYDRRLSNCGHVIVIATNAQGIKQQVRVPIIGLVAMNTITLDISHAPEIAIGDEVILVGDYPGIRAWDIAQLTKGGNPRDVTVKIQTHVKRLITP